MHFTRSDNTQNTRYFVTDHLGSTAVITDELGGVAERLSYDAWGKRRHPNGADDPTGSITSQTTKGFTGHEHIASVGLINMNARIYDPLIGRFMTPDSLVEDFFFSPVLNRYTYVGNNPLSITDPTGRSWLSKLFREVPVLRSVVAIAVAFIFQQYQVLPFIAGTAGAVANAVVGGMASGYVSSGTLKGAIIGGLTAAAFAGVHHLKDGLGFPEQAANYSAGQHLASAGMHGAVGGMASVAQGGKFGSGFLAAGFADLTGAIDTKSFAGHVAIHAVAGGIGSVLGGGKFENGAITGSFGYLFNDALERGYYSIGDDDYDDAAAWAAQQKNCGLGTTCFELLATAPFQVFGVGQVFRAGAGLLSARGGSELTRVGRWMSQAEYETMLKTGRVVEGAGGRTYVIRPPNPGSFTAAKPGSVYVEFNVPTGVLRQGGRPDWAIIPGPGITSRIFGPAPVAAAPATCIKCVIGP